MKGIQSLSALALAALLVFTSCSQLANTSEATATDSTSASNPTPDWVRSTNIYEVNVRQYTPQGTFNAFIAALPRLKDMGVQTLWFMPITPISKVDRKGVLGSYYAAQNYTAINPEFGTLDDWKTLVKEAQSMGFKVIIDWVANHTGADHGWLTKHPDFYMKDSTGKAAYAFDWSDTRELDYNNRQMRDSMISSMKWWLTETGIDGFRCDVAGEVPTDFWQEAITSLRKVKPIFMLAEATSKPELLRAGFDADYTWDAFGLMKDLAQEKKSSVALDSIINRADTAYPKNSMRMFFTSNHDENSWNKADYGTMPGAVHAPFSVLTFTLPRSIPLIYSGQEEPFLDSISFFYKDTILFNQYGRAPFYKTMLALHTNNPALHSGADFKKLTTTSDKVYAFERSSGNSKVLVAVNLSAQPRTVSWTTAPSAGAWQNVFGGAAFEAGKPMTLEPWGYRVYEQR